MVHILRVLIDLRANFDSRDDKGRQTPLILAILIEPETAARLLLDTGAELTQ